MRELTFEWSRGRKHFKQALKEGNCLYCKSQTVIPYDCCNLCLKNQEGLEIIKEYDEWGLRTCKELEKGTILTNLPFNGELLSESDLQERYSRNIAPYTIKLSKNKYLDAALVRCSISLINASKTPNCQFISLDKPKSEEKRFIYIQIIENVSPNTNLCADYEWKDKAKHTTETLDIENL